jgi:Ice-binding-like
MKTSILTLVAIAALAAVPLSAAADTSTLGTAGNYAVLGGSTITNTGSSTINGGDVGLDPGTSITGFGSVTGNYTTQVNNTAAQNAQSDLTTAYNAAAGLSYTTDLSGTDLGNLTLTAGTYFFSSSAQLTGTLTLDFEGDPNAQFVFQIGSTLTTASNSSVVSINGGAGTGCGIIWQVGSSATLGTGTSFEGHILALTSITLDNGASIWGSALARNGAVTLDSNTINHVICGSGDDVQVVPLPPAALMGLLLLPIVWLARRRHGWRTEAS